MTSGINDLFDDETEAELEKPTLSDVFDDDDDDDSGDDFATRRLEQSISDGGYLDGGENTPLELIDLPLQPAVQETRRGPVSKVGSKLPLAAAAMIVTTIVAVIIGIVGYNAMKSDPIAEPPVKNPGANSAQEPLNGNQNNGGTGNNNENGADNQAANVAVPRGGKFIRYEVKGDPSLTSASVTWFDGKGSSRSNLGVELPWSQLVGRDKDVTSAVAVNTKGSGTVTCTILDKNNKILSQRSSSGSNPTVQCSSR